MKNKAVVKYCKELRGLFEKINFAQGKFLKSYKEMLDEYVIVNPKCTYEDLVLRFGSPQDVYTNYMNEQDPVNVLKTIKCNAWKKVLTLVLIITLVTGGIVAAVKSFFYYRLYQEAYKDIPTVREVIVE